MFSVVFTTRSPFQNKFGLKCKRSRKLINIQMLPSGAALNCQTCLNASLYCYSFCAEKPPMFSLNGITAKPSELAAEVSGLRKAAL